MDLQAAERLNGSRWSIAKLTAFACFAIAVALLVAALAMPVTAGPPGSVNTATAR